METIWSDTLTCESSPTYQKVISVQTCSPRDNSKSYFHFLRFDSFKISMEAKQPFIDKEKKMNVCHKTRYSLK